MQSLANYLELKNWFWALIMSQPRIIAMMITLPIFNQEILPSMLRFSISVCLGLFLVPILLPSVNQFTATGPLIILILIKESFLGFVFGYFFAVAFWLFQAIGFLIDNQRGASIASTLDPLTGNDSSPLGQMFLQGFIVFFLVSGGFNLMLEELYDSYRLWPVMTYFPVINIKSFPLILDQLDRLVKMGMLLALPVLLAMFLAELGLALISRFVPQLQVFFIAMPIKCALAFLVLALYVGTLFSYATEYVEELKEVIPFLHNQWGPYK